MRRRPLLRARGVRRRAAGLRIGAALLAACSSAPTTVDAPGAVGEDGSEQVDGDGATTGGSVAGATDAGVADGSGAAPDAAGAADPAAPSDAVGAAPPGDGPSVTTWFDGQVPPLHPSVDGYAASTVDLVAPDGTAHRLPVRVAATRVERQHGLMEVEALPDGTGMVFLFATDRTGGFWMRDTLVPLDIAYVRADGSIADVLAMVPCAAMPCPTYPPDEPYRTALEVNAGFLDRIGLDEGWTITLSGPSPVRVE